MPFPSLLPRSKGLHVSTNVPSWLWIVRKGVAIDVKVQLSLLGEGWVEGEVRMLPGRAWSDERRRVKAGLGGDAARPSWEGFTL